MKAITGNHECLDDLYNSLDLNGRGVRHITIDIPYNGVVEVTVTMLEPSAVVLTGFIEVIKKYRLVESQK